MQHCATRSRWRKSQGGPRPGSWAWQSSERDVQSAWMMQGSHVKWRGTGMISGTVTCNWWPWANSCLPWAPVPLICKMSSLNWRMSKDGQILKKSMVFKVFQKSLKAVVVHRGLLGWARPEAGFWRMEMEVFGGNLREGRRTPSGSRDGKEQAVILGSWVLS